MNTNLLPIGMIARVAVSEFKFALENKFDCVELSTNPGAHEYFLNTLAELGQWRKYFPIPVVAIGYFGVEYHQDPSEYSKVLRLMDACNILGAKIIHLGAGSHSSEPDNDLNRVIDFFGKLLVEAQRRNLTLALYTCKVSNFAWNPKYWEKIFHDLPDLKLKYDPTHAYHTNKRDYLEEIKLWSNKIVHFHAKGGYLSPEGKRDPMGDPPPGEDQINWPAIFQILHEANYDGTVCLELHSDRYTYGEYYEALKRSKEYLLKVDKDILESSLIAVK
jgi:sugar phosphate isomerase/epimerase